MNKHPVHKQASHTDDDTTNNRCSITSQSLTAPGLSALEALRRAVKWVIFFVLCRGSLPRYYRMRRSVLHALARLGVYERSELQLLTRVVPTGGTVLDVGANFGVYSRYAASAVGAHGTVLAFEPITPVFAELTTAVRDLPQVHCFQQGISDTTCPSAQFKIPLLFGAIPEPALATVEDVSQYRCTIDAAPIVTLDSLLDGTPCPLTRVDFIKLDVEGHELACLNGARALIKKYRPLIQFEENSPHKRLALFEQFAADHSYVLAAYARAKKSLIPFCAKDCAGKGYNYYLVPREHALLTPSST